MTNPGRWTISMGLALALALTSNVVAEPATGEAAWKADLAETNDAYARRPTAILKIDDAIYLKPGQIAVLEDLPDGGHKWQLTKDAYGKKDGPPRVIFAEDSKTAVLERGAPPPRNLLGAKEPVELGGGLRIAGGMAQIEPGKSGFRAVIYNDANPHAAAFTGVDYYPYDPSYVIEAKFEPAAKIEPKTFQTSRGWYKEFFHVGDASFTLQGKQIRLPMYAGASQPAEIDSLAAFIMDDTTGTETYGVGRYIDVEVKPGTLPDKITIDFNYLYNPNCARSEHYNCPYAVDRLPVAIRAGEKTPHAQHAAQ